jgi:hypothetical protein
MHYYGRDIKLLNIIRRFIDLFPWTPLGLLVAAASYGTLLFFAYAQLDLVLLVVGYTSLALTAVTALFVSLVTIFLKLRFRGVDKDETLLLETDVPGETGFTIPALTFMPLVQVSWTWTRPAGPEVKTERRQGRLREVVCVHDRGQYRNVERSVVVEDVFGLSRMTLRVVEKLALDVLPHLGALKNLPLLVSMAGGDELPHPVGIEAGDRLELQRYVSGEPARFIHWKVYGRTRKLMTRVPERALTLSHRTAAFIVAGPEDDATAAIARLALEKKLLGNDWSFGSDENVKGSSDTAEALGILMRSSGVRDRDGKGIRAFLEGVDKKGPASSILFAPPYSGPWIQCVLEAVRFRKIHVVIGVNGIVSSQKESLWRRMVSLPARSEGTVAERLEETIRALKRGNCQITVFDRTTGRPLTERHWYVEPS